MSSYYRQKLEDYLKTQSVVGGKVLDVGGSQLPINKRLKVFEPDECTILDIGNFGTKPDITGDLNKKGNWLVDDFKKFDTAFCLEVFEYVYDPIIALHNIVFFLKEDGVLYITFPFLYPIHPPSGTDFLRYTKYGAIKLLQESGFKIVAYIPRKIKHESEWLDLLNLEKYRHDRNESREVLCESGCIIKAVKK